MLFPDEITHERVTAEITFYIFQVPEFGHVPLVCVMIFPKFLKLEVEGESVMQKLILSCWIVTDALKRI